MSSPEHGSDKSPTSSSDVRFPSFALLLAPKQLADPGPLGFGAFATTLLTLSLSMLDFRGVSNQTVFIANLCFLAGLGLLISAQWEMIRGNTFGYTVLSAFAFYYGGYGVLLIPGMGITNAYGGRTQEYYNAFGLYLFVWAILNLFFLIASLSTNIANVIIYTGLELSYIFNCAANFSMADGNEAAFRGLTKAAGSFGFLAAVAGFYVVAHQLCQTSLPFTVPIGNVEHCFHKRK